MNHYLIVYSRSQGKMLHFTEYCTPVSSKAALQDRFAYEDEHGIDPDIEVVVLGAGSVGQLKRTHGRYFFGASASLTPDQDTKEEEV